MTGDETGAWLVARGFGEPTEDPSNSQTLDEGDLRKLFLIESSKKGQELFRTPEPKK